MSEHQFTDPSDKQGNKLPSVGEYVSGLLSSAEIQKLPEDEQGKVIVDRFIGAVVRHGEVTGNVNTYAPDLTLGLIADFANGRHPNLRGVTSQDGLREAAILLNSDGRTGGLLGRLEEQFVRSEDPKTGKIEITLTSPAQIEGYIQGGGEKNHLSAYDAVPGVNMQGDEWAPILLEQVQRMSQDQYLSWNTLANARDMTTSSSPYIRNSGRDWQSAVATAEKVGVDVQLLRRSAEKIQRRNFLDKEDLGARAAFLATGGQISRYQDRLRSRSGV